MAQFNDTSAEIPGTPCLICEHGGLAFCGPGPGDADEPSRLSAMLGQVNLIAHDSVFREGDPATHLYSISQGAVKLYKLLSDGRRQVTAFLFAGDFFGLALDGGYAYTAETMTPALLCRFPRRKLEALFAEVPRLERRLLGLAIDDLAAAHEQMLLLGRKTAREKVASFLVMLDRRAARRGHHGPAVALPMSRSDIADYLGLTIETVSRTLTQFRRDGLIGLPDLGHAVLREADRLRQIADGG
ncbi:MAG: helix-turn-helix domain-containing protein [Alphaproteobacteria bacterium]|nr:helix-turn-helix domain-containing protein [Alphaproteobacteria bacterium]